MGSLQAFKRLQSAPAVPQPFRRNGYHLGHSRGKRPSRVLVGTAAEVDTTGLIFARGDAGSWDDGGVGSPVVRCYIGDNEERWFLWYSGCGASSRAKGGLCPSAGSVGVALSNDGVNWTRGRGKISGMRGPAGLNDAGEVLGPNGDWWTFDTLCVSPGDVQVLSNSSVNTGVGVYWMFYSGSDHQEVKVPHPVEDNHLSGFRMRPGLAMSQDGKHWARIEGDHYTGALFDVGEEGQWDELFVGQPQMVAAGPGDMRLYYHSYDPRAQQYVVGLARSRDGFKWKKEGVIFRGSQREGAHDEQGAAARYVVRDVDSKKYFMFYEAVSRDNMRSIGLAVSDNGLTNWQVVDRPVLEPSSTPSAWDGGAVGAPCAVSMSGGRWRLYYAGRSSTAAGPWEGIGLALSTESSLRFQQAPVAFRRRGSSQG